MQFKFANALSYQDLGSGQVLHSAPGFPSFPARLGIELFERAREVAGVEYASFWDPMCGAGGVATTIGIACGDAVSRILATDISTDSLAIAQRNLSLTSAEGISRRIGDLKRKGAHPSRILSAERLAKIVRCRKIPFRTTVADVTNSASLKAIVPGSVDVVFADVPYGLRTSWQSTSSTPIASMIAALWHVLPPHGVIVIAALGRGSFNGTPLAHRSYKHGHRIIKMYRCRDITC
jgi:23S rRNA (guanine2535-N1)-methyltransferase